MPNIPLIITIRDYIYKTNITVPEPEIPIKCIPFYKCELPLNGYESDGCGNRRLNSLCNTCVPLYKCELPLNGYESDGCGNRRLNSLCNPCPQFTNPLCPDGDLIPRPNDPVTGCLSPSFCKPKPPETRIVRILPEGVQRLPNANTGETITITATVICKTDNMISTPRDLAYFIVDGAIADQKIVDKGTVTFDWEATSVPINIHTLCVKVSPSESCKSPGQDCKRITVSSVSLDITEQIAKERTAGLEQRKLLKEARSKLREEIIGAELEIPVAPAPIISQQPSVITQPTLTQPIQTTPITQPISTQPELTQPIQTTPITQPISTQPEITQPTVIAQPIQTTPVTQPITQPSINYGSINIVGLPPQLLPTVMPIYLYLDNKNIGRLFEIPNTISNVPVGTHRIFARGGSIISITKKVVVYKDKTSNITL